MTKPERRRRWREATARYKARLRERAMALFGDRCQECGLGQFEDYLPSRLEFAHVGKTELKGRSRGSGNRFRDVLKHPDRYALLCRPCHMDLDYAGSDPWAPRESDPNQLELEAVPF